MKHTAQCLGSGSSSASSNYLSQCKLSDTVSSWKAEKMVFLMIRILFLLIQRANAGKWGHYSKFVVCMPCVTHYASTGNPKSRPRPCPSLKVYNLVRGIEDSADNYTSAKTGRGWSPWPRPPTWMIGSETTHRHRKPEKFMEEMTHELCI